MSLSFQLSFFALLRYPGQWNHWWNMMLMLLADNKSSSVRTFIRQNHLLMARKHWSSWNIRYSMQSGTEFGNKTKENIRILIRYSELKDFFSPHFQQAILLLPVWQGDEVFILRSFVTRKVSLLKLLQHNLAVLEKIMAQITTMFRGRFLNK